MHRSRWLAAPLASSLFAVAIAGCGGGGSTQVSAQELVQKADAICGQELRSFDRIQAHPPPNASVAADQTDELIDVTQTANSQLHDLEPPDQLRAAYDRYLAARDRAVAQMKRGKDAARDQDSDAYGAAQAAVARDASQRRKLARALGLKRCSTAAATT
jgi:hypothetical protein